MAIEPCESHMVTDKISMDYSEVFPIEFTLFVLPFAGIINNKCYWCVTQV
jgi:hypothetical protein